MTRAAVPKLAAGDSGALTARFLASVGRSTAEAYGRDLRAWGAWLAKSGVAPLDAVAAHVEAFRDEEARRYQPATVGRRLCALSGFYALAVAEGMIAESPVAAVVRPEWRYDRPAAALTRAEFGRLLVEAERSDPRWRLRWVALVCLCEWVHVSEALHADVSDLVPERGRLTLRLRKSGATLLLRARAAEAVQQLVGDRREGPVFVTRHGTRMERTSASKAVKRLARRAGLAEWERVSPERLLQRRRAAALDDGQPLSSLRIVERSAVSRLTRAEAYPVADAMHGLYRRGLQEAQRARDATLSASERVAWDESMAAMYVVVDRLDRMMREHG